MNPKGRGHSEREFVAGTKLGHVVSNGVEMSRDPEGVPVNVCINAEIINLDNDVLDPWCLGSTSNMLSIGWDYATQGLNSTQVIHMVIDMQVTEKGT